MDVVGLSNENAAEAEDLLDNVDHEYFHHTGADVEGFLAKRDDVHVLGRVDGQAVVFGMLRGWADGFDVPSLGIAVRRDLEGLGHGAAMMSALEMLARQHGAHRIRLRVHPAHVRARRLYEKLGYGEIGTERGEILMIRDLT